MKSFHRSLLMACMFLVFLAFLVAYKVLTMPDDIATKEDVGHVQSIMKAHAANEEATERDRARVLLNRIKRTEVKVDRNAKSIQKVEKVMAKK